MSVEAQGEVVEPQSVLGNWAESPDGSWRGKITRSHTRWAQRVQRLSPQPHASLVPVSPYPIMRPRMLLPECHPQQYEANEPAQNRSKRS